MRLIFSYPSYLWILLALPFLVLVHLLVLRFKKALALKFANFEALEKIAKKSFLSSPKGLFAKKNPFLVLLRTLAYSFFILSICGAMIEYEGRVSNFDFVLAIDTSSSMLADDFDPNRLEAAKEAALLFVDSVATQTSIGVISFAGDVFIDLEPTKGARKIKKAIMDLDAKEVGGTNIGDALITAGNTFEGENPKRIVLLTDGQANIGTEPMDALSYLNTKDITVYTIGVATKEGGKVEGEFVSKLDEGTLNTIAEKTDGKYYRAESKEVLKETFEEIANLTVQKISFDLSWILLIIGFVLLFLEWFLTSTRYKILP